jgi:hypothetical protein
VLTNEKQLELLLTRQSDIELFDNAALDFLVFGEAHTYSGSTGAETAVPIRRLRSFCGRSPERTVCVGTSATLADRERQETGCEFASRFLGVNADGVEMATEQSEPDLWARTGIVGRRKHGTRTGAPAPECDTPLRTMAPPPGSPARTALTSTRVRPSVNLTSQSQAQRQLARRVRLL